MMGLDVRHHHTDKRKQDMSIIVMSGCATGIGAATRKVLEAADAFDVLDERLAKYIRPEWLTDEEKKVIQVLADRYAAGIINGWEQ